MRTATPSSFDLFQAIGKAIGRVEQHAEIVRVVGVLPEVVRARHQPPAESLFQTGVVLVAVSGVQGLADRSENVRRKTAHAGGARQDQILVVGRLERARVRGAHHGSGRLDQVRESDARLGAGIRDNSVIDVHPQARLHLEVAELDVVLSKEGVLIDIRALIELEQLPARLGQVIGNQSRQEVSVWRPGTRDRSDR